MRIRATVGLGVVVLAAATAWADPPLNLNTNLGNYYIRGTQPNTITATIEYSGSCAACHSTTVDSPIYDDWAGNLMAHAGRDPVMYACMDIANAEAPGIGDACIRCHMPKAWLEGRSTPTDASAVTVDDRDSITCHFCHRLVDPYNKPGAPAADSAILAALGADLPIQSMDLGMPSMPGDNGSAGYVVDPQDRRRGPRNIIPSDVWLSGQPLPPNDACCDFFHEVVGSNDTFTSALHRRSDICATCHDVSFGHLMRQPDGSYTFNGTGNHHPTGNKYDMIPEQRTYSEWLKSDFATTGVDMGGRFGGLNHPIIRDCQDCHMPVDDVQACLDSRSLRVDTRRHYFSGAATWVLDAIGAHYGQGGTSGTNELGDDVVLDLAANKQRNIGMLQRAADLDLSIAPNPMTGQIQLKARVVNQTGHKLPTAYPAGRRIFLSVQFFSAANPGTPIAEYGHYDFNTATLDESNTKVYQAEFGLDANIAAALNRPVGPSHHAALSNKLYFDNRIPPRGFTNANYAAIQAPHVGYSYSDGQYWDDTYYPIPAGACSAVVQLYYQASTREYMEFLRDNNPNAAQPDDRGELAYNLWQAFGLGEPVLMAVGAVDVATPGDTNLNGAVTVADIPSFIAVLLGVDNDPNKRCAADVNHDGVVNGRDVTGFADLLTP